MRVTSSNGRDNEEALCLSFHLVKLFSLIVAVYLQTLHMPLLRIQSVVHAGPGRHNGIWFSEKQSPGHGSQF